MKKTFTKALSLLLIAVLPSLAITKAQVSNYIFSQNSGTYTPITGGNILVPDNNSTESDDEVYQLNDIGFTFNFNGTDYSNFGINSNGFIWFGSGIPDPSIYSPISEPSANLKGSGSIDGVISPLGSDLLKKRDLPYGELRIQTIGNAPSRMCVIQFANWSGFGAGTNTIYNFQISLHETTNQVSFIYGLFSTDAEINDFQIGLRGADNIDYKNVVCTTNNWSGVALGNSATASSLVNTTIFPADGTTFLWTPPTSALPITLTTFNATRDGAVNKLKWAVNKEIGSAKFILQRSTDSKNFADIATIAEENKSIADKNYYYTDISPNKGVNYYRLKTIESNGQAKFSAIKSVRNLGTADVSVYPNPVKESVSLVIVSDATDKVNISITDINGKLVYNKNGYAVNKGENKLNMPANQLKNGTYVIKIQLMDDVVVKRIIKQ